MVFNVVCASTNRSPGRPGLFNAADALAANRAEVRAYRQTWARAQVLRWAPPPADALRGSLHHSHVHFCTAEKQRIPIWDNGAFNRVVGGPGLAEPAVTVKQKAIIHQYYGAGKRQETGHKVQTAARTAEADEPPPSAQYDKEAARFINNVSFDYTLYYRYIIQCNVRDVVRGRAAATGSAVCDDTMDADYYHYKDPIPMAVQPHAKYQCLLVEAYRQERRRAYACYAASPAPGHEGLPPSDYWSKLMRNYAFSPAADAAAHRRACSRAPTLHGNKGLLRSLYSDLKAAYSSIMLELEYATNEAERRIYQRAVALRGRRRSQRVRARLCLPDDGAPIEVDNCGSYSDIVDQYDSDGASDAGPSSTGARPSFYGLSPPLPESRFNNTRQRNYEREALVAARAPGSLHSNYEQTFGAGGHSVIMQQISSVLLWSVSLLCPPCTDACDAAASLPAGPCGEDYLLSCYHYIRLGQSGAVCLGTIAAIPYMLPRRLAAPARRLAFIPHRTAPLPEADTAGSACAERGVPRTITSSDSSDEETSGPAYNINQPDDNVPYETVAMNSTPNNHADGELCIDTQTAAIINFSDVSTPPRGNSKLDTPNTKTRAGCACCGPSDSHMNQPGCGYSSRHIAQLRDDDAVSVTPRYIDPTISIMDGAVGSQQDEDSTPINESSSRS